MCIAHSFLISCTFLSLSLAKPLNDVFDSNIKLDNVHLNARVINDLYSSTCTDDGAKGAKCVQKFVENTLDTVVDNDSSSTLIPGGELALKDDSVDVSAYNESADGLSNLQVVANKSTEPLESADSTGIVDEEDDVIVEVLNGKINGKKIIGSVELDELLDLGGKKFKIPIYGTLHDFAYYFIKIFIGTPPSVQWVVLDTGSSLLGITCGNCIQCGNHQNPNYEPYESATAIKCTDVNQCKLKGCDECRFMQHYSEGSFISGDYYTDVISFDKSSPGYKFNNLGCVLYENKLIYNQRANGIFGMSPNDDSIISQLFKRPEIDNIFSICLSDEGGELIIGGIEPELFNIKNNSEMAWTRLNTDNNYYIHINSMSYLSDHVEITNTKFSIDSGTTNTVLMENMYKSIVNGVMNICFMDREIEGYDLDIGVTVIQKKPDDIVDLMIEREENVTKCEIHDDEICSRNIDKFPPLDFTLEGGNILTINPDTYFFKRNSWWCLGVEKSKDGENIFGANFFRNKQLIFTSDKLGFVPSNCTSHSINI